MFELPPQFKQFITPSITLKVTSQLNLTFNLPSCSKLDWSSLYADKMAMGSSSHHRFFKRCVLAACCTHINDNPISALCSDAEFKAIASKVEAGDFSKVSPEKVLNFYEVVLTQIIGPLPETLIERVYVKFDAWCTEKNLELIPIADEFMEDIQQDNDIVLGLLGKVDRGTL